MATPTQQQIMDDAALSAAVYDDVRKQDNLINLTIGWYINNPTADVMTNTQGLGFAATAYHNGNNIVISYEGTDLNNIPNIIADAGTDLLSGLGFGSPQIIQAALFYEQVKKDNPNANITFTGHSLGGGLELFLVAFLQS